MEMNLIIQQQSRGKFIFNVFESFTELILLPLGLINSMLADAAMQQIGIQIIWLNSLLLQRLQK